MTPLSSLQVKNTNMELTRLNRHTWCYFRLPRNIGRNCQYDTISEEAIRKPTGYSKSSEISEGNSQAYEPYAWAQIEVINCNKLSKSNLTS